MQLVEFIHALDAGTKVFLSIYIPLGSLRQPVAIEIDLEKHSSRVSTRAHAKSNCIRSLKAHDMPYRRPLIRSENISQERVQSNTVMMPTMKINATEVAPRTGRQDNAFYARLSGFTGNGIQTLKQEPVSLVRLDSLIHEVKFTISSSDLERWSIIEIMLKESTNQGIPKWGWPPGETARWFFDLYLFDFHHQAQRQYYDSISTTVLGGLEKDPI